MTTESEQPPLPDPNATNQAQPVPDATPAPASAPPRYIPPEERRFQGRRRRVLPLIAANALLTGLLLFGAGFAVGHWVIGSDHHNGRHGDSARMEQRSRNFGEGNDRQGNLQ